MIYLKADLIIVKLRKIQTNNFGHITQYDSCDVIKMREMRGEVRKKTPKKIWIIPHFYDVTWLIL